MIFALLMTPLLVGLGVWQLNRGDEKKALIKQQAEGRQEQHIELTDLNTVDWHDSAAAEQWNYKNVDTRGRFDRKVYLLLDNRTRNGHVGYEVINLFRTDNGQAVWVNRGWVKAPLYRDQWPDIEPVLGDVEITGSVYYKNTQAFTLADNPTTLQWPKRIQALDMTGLMAELKQDIYPFTLRLIDDEQPGALKTGWRVSIMSSDKHFGYAVQWFSLAFVLVVMTAIAIKKNNTTEVEKTHDS
ncbi:SURF1 family protein [Alkalimarinus alittae]|uniref:SURF1-like protein n=1 Tax=Alkalimarinus alittae TaxID=2961619 RepID=A0ABY6N282_9ALTE|nr:SURF1 family protein [Alkalimarinus alittae]UZE96109.1 SURF1 family protein [Alkalimarinus alittae]